MKPRATHSATRRLLATNVRAIRLRRKISQEELAEAAGIAQQTLSELETAKRNVSVDLLGHVADALDVDVAELFAKQS